jgi:nicotinamidase-related amidase
MSRFAACIRRLDIPAAVTELYGYGRLIPEVAEKLGEERTERILRRELSAWGSADFAGIINSSSARKVLIAGLETHAAVLQTAIDFRRKGYDVSIIEDCCASREGHDHKIAIERLRDEGCRITTSRAAIMELVSAVNHPAAESIARLLK